MARGTISGTTASCRVNKSDHGNKEGLYITHIYAYDAAANNTGTAVPGVTVETDNSAPVIGDVRVSDVNSDGYTVLCSIEDNVGVTRVMFPTWPSADDSGNPIWHEGTISGTTASCTIRRIEHGGKYGSYFTHIYAYDAQGNYSASAVPMVSVEKPCSHDYCWIIDKDATCGEDGSKHQECTLCHEKGETVIIPKTNAHHYGSWEVIEKATVLKTGSEIQTCTVCHNATETATIAKLKPTLTLNVNGTVTLKTGKAFTAKVGNMAEGDYVDSWASSDEGIVAVDNTGKITAANKTGTVTITVTLASGKTASFKVKVQTGTIKTTKLTVKTGKKVTLKKGKTFALKCSVTPVTSTQKITYQTANKNIATVTSKGAIKGIKKGKTTITVTSGSKKVKVTVTVL